MDKFISYDSSDETNFSVAEQIMARFQAILVPAHATNGPIVARLIDLEHQPFGDRQPILNDLLQQPITCPIAVHSYHLEEDLASQLRDRGILVFRKLGDYVIDVLLDLSEQWDEQPLPLASPYRTPAIQENKTEAVLDTSDSVQS